MDGAKTMENSSAGNSSELLIIEDDSNDVAVVEKAAGKSEAKSPRKRKQSRKKRPYDTNAPQRPLTGYTRFYIERKNAIRLENKDISGTDMTRLIAKEWCSITADDKHQYLEQASKEKEKYLQEMEKYKHTDSYKAYQKKLAQQEAKKAKKLCGNAQKVGKYAGHSGTDIMIFTDDFLDHNRLRESELRELRKESMELEEQNATHAKHVEKLKTAIAKLEVESVQQRNTNQMLVSHIDKLRNLLAKSLSHVKIPWKNENVNASNVDKFIVDLQKYCEENVEEYHSTVTQVKSVISKLNLKIFEKM